MALVLTGPYGEHPFTTAGSEGGGNNEDAFPYIGAEYVCGEVEGGYGVSLQSQQTPEIVNGYAFMRFYLRLASGTPGVYTTEQNASATYFGGFPTWQTKFLNLQPGTDYVVNVRAYHE